MMMRGALVAVLQLAVEVLYVSTTSYNKSCDRLGILLYEDMSCKPNFDGSSRSLCPTKFDCIGLKKSNKDQCFFKGRTYAKSEWIDSRLTRTSCDLGCYCKKDKDDSMKFKCAAVDCPEWKGPPRQGCYRKYSLDDCCSIREVCPPFDNFTTCLYEGKEYKEGENFLPADSCWRCVCQPGFRGQIEEPFCRRRTCGTQTKYQDKLQQRCAPVYYKKTYRYDDPLCCPAMWVCGEGNEKLTGRPRSDKKCMFGQRILRVGQGFEKKLSMARNLTVNCECSIPPLVTCTTNVI